MFLTFGLSAKEGASKAESLLPFQKNMFRRFLRVKGDPRCGVISDGSPTFLGLPLLAAGDDGSALFPPRYITVREMKGDVKTGHHLSVKGTASFAPCFQI